MGEVVFVDTSVLLNVLNVPGNCKPHEHERDKNKMEELQQANAILILPMTALIETGNAVAKVSGSDKYNVTERYLKVVRATVEQKAPWTFSGTALNGALVEKMLSSTGSIPGLVDLMKTSVGTGDAAILQEVAQYQSNVHLPSGTPIRIWTHDVGLQAYIP
jgi:hypothetical protein